MRTVFCFLLLASSAHAEMLLIEVVMDAKMPALPTFSQVRFDPGYGIPRVQTLTPVVSESHFGVEFEPFDQSQMDALNAMHCHGCPGALFFVSFGVVQSYMGLNLDGPQSVSSRHQAPMTATPFATGSLREYHLTRITQTDRANSMTVRLYGVAPEPGGFVLLMLGCHVMVGLLRTRRHLDPLCCLA